MMSKITVSLFMIYSVLLAVGVYSLTEYLRADPREPVITDKTPVESNVIRKNPYDMKIEDLQSDALCLYTGFTDLGIQSIGKGDYMLSASLCERRWQKVVNIKARDSPRHFFIPGIAVKSRLIPGVSAKYYQLLSNNFGVGGGATCFRDKDFQIEGSGVIAW